MKSNKIKNILGIRLFIVIAVIHIVYLRIFSEGLLDFLPDWMATPIALLFGLVFTLLLILESYKV